MSWSLDTWGNQGRLSAADTFLRTGIVTTTFGGTGCTSSTQCASGYKCSGGRCVPIQTAGGSGGSGGVSTGGDSDPCDGGGDGDNSGNTGPGGSGCSSPAPIGGGGGGCTTSTCGQGTYAYGEDSDCCGERCCRYFATGSGVSVNCYCGPCPTEVKPCNQFCSEYYEANGTLSAGCSRDYICDECTECSGSLEGGGNYCEEKNDLPCHCNGAEVEDCDICNDDGSISPGECLECCEISNYDCGSGIAVSTKVCQERGVSGPSVCNLAQDAARQRCAEELGGDGSGGGDNCQPKCDSKTTPPAAGPCPSPDDPIGDCPDGFDCQWTGCIEAGGQHVTLYNECNVAELPDECKACDCNCNNDCPDCQLCGADGKCYPDPSCPTCEGSRCPGVSGGCCPEDTFCYMPNPDSDTGDCCPSDNIVVDIYDSVFQINGCGNTLTLRTLGPPDISQGNCIACNGSYANCGDFCARPRMRVNNLLIGSSVVPTDVAFEDTVAPTCCSLPSGWCPIAFPIMLSSEVAERACISVPSG